MAGIGTNNTVRSPNFRADPIALLDAFDLEGAENKLLRASWTEQLVCCILTRILSALFKASVLPATVKVQYFKYPELVKDLDELPLINYVLDYRMFDSEKDEVIHVVAMLHNLGCNLQQEHASGLLIVCEAM